MHETFMPILQSVVASLGAVLLVALGLPFLARRKQAAEATLKLVTTIAEKAVMALEQTRGELPGAEKKRLAEELVSEALRHFCIRVPQQVIDMAIEAGVLLIKKLGRKAA